jgi:hypothetical protein
LIFRDMKDAGTSGTSGTGKIKNSRPSSDIAFDAEPDSEFEERAAVLWDGTSAPLEWIEGFARLNVTRRPKGFSQAQWERVLDDGGRFLDGGWAEKAADVGWSAKDAFGVHPLAPNARYDAMGLVPLMRGGEIIDLTASGNHKDAGWQLPDLLSQARVFGGDCALGHDYVKPTEESGRHGDRRDRQARKGRGQGQAPPGPLQAQEGVV